MKDKVTTSLITSEEILIMLNNQTVIAPKSGQISNGQPTTNKCVEVQPKTSVGNSNKLGSKPMMVTILSKLVPISEEVVPSLLMMNITPPKNTISGGPEIGTTMVF